MTESSLLPSGKVENCSSFIVGVCCQVKKGKMWCWWLSVLALVPLCLGNSLRFEPEYVPDFGILSDQEIDYVNSLGTTWKAGRNFPISRARGVLRMLGARLLPKEEEEKILPVKTGSMGLELPEHFDPRIKWPKCKSLSEIRDQGNCGSCWAFGAVEAITDRICIHSQGASKPRISAEDLMTCCKGMCGDGCDGGTLIFAWHFWMKQGIVTGGDYGSNQGCQPYEIKPCGLQAVGKHQPCPSKVAPTPKCSHQCESSYNSTYDQDKHYGAQSYIIRGGAPAMQEELFTNGPIACVFIVYSDFLNYKSGVYQQVSGDPLGFHAIKILGWGVEKGTPYWRVANSWGTDWGDKGFFKILRGINECGIEEACLAGIPAHSKH